MTVYSAPDTVIMPCIPMVTDSWCAEGPTVNTTGTSQTREEGVQAPSGVLPAPGHRGVREEQALGEARRPGVLRPGPGAPHPAPDAQYPTSSPHFGCPLDPH